MTQFSIEYVFIIQYNFWLIWKMSQKLLLKSWKIHSVMKKWKKYTIVVWKAAKWLGFWWQFYILLENASSQAFQYSTTLNVWNSLSKWVMKKDCKWKIKNFSKRLYTQSFFIIFPYLDASFKMIFTQNYELSDLMHSLFSTSDHSGGGPWIGILISRMSGIYVNSVVS